MSIKSVMTPQELIEFVSDMPPEKQAKILSHYAHLYGLAEGLMEGKEKP